MNKVSEAFRPSFGDYAAFSSANGQDTSDRDLNINQKVAQFLMLLQQLDESAGGLEALPSPELSEIVSGALGVCGFVDPIEAREVIATLLEAIEKPDPVFEVARFGSMPVQSN